MKKIQRVLSNSASTKLYKKLLTVAAQRTGLRTPVEIKIDRWWYFHVAEKNFTIYCPPYHKEFEPTFLHYICHAKILEDGWKRPKISSKIAKDATDREATKKEQRRFISGCINRSADSFFDFYVWKFVTEKFGKDYFLRFTKPIVAHRPEDVIKGFKRFYSSTGSTFTNYCVCLDWFAVLYVLSEEIDAKRRLQLNNLWSALSRNRNFKKLVPPGTKQKIRWLRNFYQNLSEAYPTYKDLLNNRSLEMQFKKYYDKIWRNTGLKIKVVGFI